MLLRHFDRQLSTYHKMRLFMGWLSANVSLESRILYTRNTDNYLCFSCLILKKKMLEKHRPCRRIRCIFSCVFFSSSRNALWWPRAIWWAWFKAFIFPSDYDLHRQHSVEFDNEFPFRSPFLSKNNFYSKQQHIVSSHQWDDSFGCIDNLTIKWFTLNVQWDTDFGQICLDQQFYLDKLLLIIMIVSFIHRFHSYFPLETFGFFQFN